MRPVTRKIGFYSLVLELNADREQTLPAVKLKDVLAYIAGLEKLERQNVLSDDSYCFLSDIESIENREDIQKILFKRAGFGSRPPLVDKETLEERDNPKELTEGERVLTHAALRYFDDEVFVLLETVPRGVTINRVERYLNEYASMFHQSTSSQKNYTIRYKLVATENFSEALSRLRRVTVGNIFVEKQYLGSEPLNLSNRIRDVQEQIAIKVNAKRTKSIEEFIEDAYAVFQTADSKVLRVRAEGFNRDNQPVTIDTDILRKTEPLDFEPDILTGEIKSDQVFHELVKMIQQVDL